MNERMPVLSVLVLADADGNLHIEAHRHALDHFKVIAAGGALAANGWQAGLLAARAPVEPLRAINAEIAKA